MSNSEIASGETSVGSSNEDASSLARRANFISVLSAVLAAVSAIVTGLIWNETRTARVQGIALIDFQGTLAADRSLLLVQISGTDFPLKDIEVIPIVSTDDNIRPRSGRSVRVSVQPKHDESSAPTYGVKEIIGEVCRVQDFQPCDYSNIVGLDVKLFVFGEPKWLEVIGLSGG